MVEDKKLARALSLDWAGIKSNGLKDAGLFPFVEKLFAAELLTGEIISALRRECVEHLANWLEQEIQQGRFFQKDWIPELVQKVHAHPDYQNALQGPLNTWQEEKFKREFENLKRQIEEALSQWEVETAERLLNQSVVPVALQEQVDDLRAKLDWAKEDKIDLETLMQKVSTIGHSHDWSSVQSAIDCWQQLEQFKVKTIPTRWQRKIDDHLKTLKTETNNFFQSQVESCNDLTSVRAFYANFKQLKMQNETNFLEDHWFEGLKNAYQTQLKKELENASLEKVGHVMERIKTDLGSTESLPPTLTNWLQDQSDEVVEKYKQKLWE
jgi:hypothetical protein